MFVYKVSLTSEIKWRTLICTNYAKLKSNIILITYMRARQMILYSFERERRDISNELQIAWIESLVDE